MSKVMDMDMMRQIINVLDQLSTHDIAYTEKENRLVTGNKYKIKGREIIRLHISRSDNNAEKIRCADQG